MSVLSRRADFYADADLYDILHTEGTRADMSAVLRLVRRFGPSEAKVRGAVLTLLEPACGSGRYVIELARRGHRCRGFDLRMQMVRYARRRASELGVSRLTRFFHARMERFVVSPRERAHGAFNLINSIRHLTSDRAMLAHFACMERALRPGGVYVVGLGPCAYGLERETEDVWIGSRDGVRATQTVQYIPPSATRGSCSRIERVISHVVATKGRGRARVERHVDSCYTLRTYNLAQWHALLERARWDVLATTDQDGVPAAEHEPGYFLWVLRPSRGAPRTISPHGARVV